MNKYIITILLFNSLSSQIIENNFLNRTKYNLKTRQQSIIQSNNYRDEEELLQFIESTMQTHLIPGLSISIVKDEHIVWEKYFGYADISDEILVDEETMFILSSVSKTITATALMQLWEQGLFGLDDNINNYLPFNVVHPDYPFSEISFKMLLSHTSGIKDNWSVMDYYDGDSELELGYYLEQYFVFGGEFYNSNSNFTDSAPGTNRRYSNIGAALIGYLVETISNQSFNEYCYDNIFMPLNMSNAYWFLSEISDLTQVAMPYSLSGGSGDTCYEIGCGIYDESNPCCWDAACVGYNDCCPDYEEVCGEDGTGGSQTNLSEQYHYGYSDYPSGQLRTSSNNLAKFMAAYINGGIYNGVRILDSETVELIKTIHYPDVASQQGLIWYYKNSSGRTLLGHNGGDIGSSTEMFVNFEDNIGVVVFTNSSNYDATIQIENALFDFAEQTTFSVLGDINSDGLINILDVILVINIILEADSFDGLADINLDGQIDVLDIVQIINIILY